MSRQLFIDILKQHNLRVTPQRVDIFTALLAHSPMTTVEIGDLLLHKLDRATVYRSLELFEAIGVTTQVWIGERSMVELGEAFLPHHHHAVCTTCRAHIGLTSETLEAVLTQRAEELDFKADTHTVNIIGTCRACLLAR